MAQNLARGGLQPLSDAEGGACATVRRRVASGNGTAIFCGDPLTYTAAGVVGLATAGSGLIGVSILAEYFDTASQSRKSGFFLPANTTYSSTAFDVNGGETDQSFLLMSGSPVTDRFVVQYSTGLPALTDLTKNANFTLATAGSTVSGISGCALDQTTIAATQGLDLRILDIYQNVLSDPTQGTSTGGIEPSVIVQINATSSTGGVPVIGGGNTGR